MTVYVDNMRMTARVGRITARWSHLQADTDEELHAFAEKLGMKRAWFQEYPDRPEKNHYDVVDARRAEAIRMGAVPEDMAEGSARRRAKRDEDFRLGWLGIRRSVLDAEERTLNRRLTSGDLCRGTVDEYPGTCVRPPDHKGRCYRLPYASEA